jgi:hypothetical protein
MTTPEQITDVLTSLYYTAREKSKRDFLDIARAALATTKATDAVRFFWQQHTLSDTSAMSMAELHNDTECVIRGHRASPMTDAIATTEGALTAAQKWEIAERVHAQCERLKPHATFRSAASQAINDTLEALCAAPSPKPAVDALTEGAVNRRLLRILVMRHAKSYSEWDDGSLSRVDFGQYGFDRFVSALIKETAHPASEPQSDALTTGAVAKPYAWCIDPGAGSACDRFQTVEPYGWQYAEVERRGGSITPLYDHPASGPKAALFVDNTLVERLSIKHGGPVDGEGWCINKSGLYDFLHEYIRAVALLADRGSEGGR